ncbi:hypothetical protein A5717_26235 [Mycolicibacterium porcinum]|uniref:DUF7352 domain-containing protein n=1 Tax=Mycolicibacterium porcinum TaxID=39693 RepID=UPI00080B14CC|nr:hypothetical protein [Mycolicibacterium porcinum]OCB09274.1 hypothetical protein A5717_26235 [Mycolicibacterium porcinum]
MRILRHEIAITDYQVIELPASGELLSVAPSRVTPDSALDVWSVDYQLGLPMRVEVLVVGTGNPVPGPYEESILAGNFLGTAVCPGGLVWHVWQGKIL